jgi:hypothetical protein
MDTSQFLGLTSSQKIVNTSTRVGMRIYPADDRPGTYRPERPMTVRRIGWDRDSEAALLQFQWTKQLGTPSGQWQATFKAKGADNSIIFEDQQIGDGDWIDITILRNGVPIPLCRGIIDSVRSQTSVVGAGVTSRTYSVSGRDHGAFFEYPITWSSLWARTLSQLCKGLFTERAKGKVGGRPDEIFKVLIEGTFKGTEKLKVPSGQWVLPKSLTDTVGSSKVKLSDLLQVVAFNAEKGYRGLRGAYFNQPQLWMVGEQTLHQTLMQWVNPLMNEWWCDLFPAETFVPGNNLAAFLSRFQDLSVGNLPNTADTEITIDEKFAEVQDQAYRAIDQKFGSIAALIRERPFPTRQDGRNSMWFALPTWRIPIWLVSATDLGRSGHQRYNLFEILGSFGAGTQQEQAAMTKPVWREEGIRHHGLRTYSQETRYFAKSRSEANWQVERNIWIERIVDWFAPNPYMEQGTITLRAALPEIRVGHRLLLEDSLGRPRQFYVEGIAITTTGPSVSAGASGETILTVTRGFRGSDGELITAVQELGAKYKAAF